MGTRYRFIAAIVIASTIHNYSVADDPAKNRFSLPPKQPNQNAKVTSTQAVPISQWRQLSDLRFTGIQQVKEELIRRELLAQPEVYAALHPTIDAAIYQACVLEAVSRGFLNSGFFDASVTSPTPEGTDEPMTIHVVEGPRYVLGDLKIGTGKPIDQDRIAKSSCWR